MAINFPSFPILNDIHIHQGLRWVWDGSSWSSTGEEPVPGYVGSQGNLGYVGSIGFVGSQGVIGYVGSIGFVGSQGVTGLTGSRGPSGSYLGNYDNSVTYGVGESVRFDSRIWVAITINLGITPTNGPNWFAIAADPQVGTVAFWAGAPPDATWLPARGGVVSQVTYPELFSITGARPDSSGPTVSIPITGFNANSINHTVSYNEYNGNTVFVVANDSSNTASLTKSAYSTDGMQTWVAASNPLADGGISGPLPRQLSSINNVLFYLVRYPASSTSRLYKSVDVGNSWSWDSSIGLSHPFSSPNTIYHIQNVGNVILVHRDSSGNLYRSTNNGNTWETVGSFGAALYSDTTAYINNGYIDGRILSNGTYSIFHSPSYNPRLVVRSTDGFLTYTSNSSVNFRVSTNSLFSLGNLFFVLDSNFGVATSTISVSSDGFNWSTPTGMFSGNYNPIPIKLPNNFVLINAGIGRILVSNNGFDYSQVSLPTSTESINGVRGGEYEPGKSIYYASGNTSGYRFISSNLTDWFDLSEIGVSTIITGTYFDEGSFYNFPSGASLQKTPVFTYNTDSEFVLPNISAKVMPPPLTGVTPYIKALP